MVDVLSPSARQYTASALKPESVYVFRLTAQTRNGWGEAAEALVVTTEKRGAQGTHIKYFNYSYQRHKRAHSSTVLDSSQSSGYWFLPTSKKHASR